MTNSTYTVIAWFVTLVIVSCFLSIFISMVV